MRKILALLATASWITLAAATPANAGPLAAAIGAFSTFLASGTTGALLVKTLLGVALNVGSSLLQRAMAKKRLSGGISSSVQVGGDVSRSFGVGRYATKGSLAYPPKTWGNSGDTPNAHLVYVVSLSDIPGVSLRRVFINGEAVTLSDTPHAFAGYPVEEYQIDGGTYAYVKFYDGTQSDADSYLLDKFGDDDDHPFISDMVGNGVSYAILTFVRDDARQPDLWSGFPDVLFEMDGVPLYDRREDDTAGGDGDQRQDDPETWATSANPYIIAEGILRGIEYDGDWQWGMQGLYPAALPVEEWSAAQNAADLPIDLDGGGTVPQFQYGREIAYSDEPINIIDDIMASAQGRLAESGGVYKPLCGVPGAAVYSFTDEDIVVTSEQELDPFPAPETTHNGATGTYLDPENSWAVADASYYRDDLETEDQGFRLTADLQFSGVSENTQVQRLLKAAVEDSRRFRRHIITLPPATWVFEPNDVFSWSSARNGYVNKLFIVTMKDELPNGNQVFGLHEIDASDYDWTPSTDERTHVTYPVVVRRPPPQPVVDFDAVPWAVQDSASSNRRPAIKILWDPNITDVSGVAWEIRLKTTSEQVITGRTERFAAGQAIVSANILPAETYEVRAWYIPSTPRRVVVSGWIEVTTWNLLVATVDIFDDAITAAKITDGAVKASKIEEEAVTSIKLATDAVTATKIATGAVLTSKLDDNAVTIQKLMDGAVTATKIATGAVLEDKLATNAVTVAKLANDAVTAAKIATGAVEANKLANGAVTDVKIATDAVTATKIATGAVLEDKLAANAVTVGKIANGSITATKVEDGAISTPKLAAGSVTTAKVAAGAITANEIDTGAVTAVKVAAGAITADKLAAGSVVAGKVAAGAIGTTELAANSVVASKILVTDFSNMVPDSFAQDQASWTLNDWSWFDNSAPTYTTFSSKSVFRINAYDPPVEAWQSVGELCASSIFPVHAGKRYFVSILHRRFVVGSSRVRLNLVFRDQSGSTVGSSHASAASQTNLAGPQTCSMEIEAPATAATLQVRVQLWKGDGFASGAIIGDFFVKQMSNAELIVDGAIIADKLAAGSVTTAKVAAGAITANEIAAGTITAAQIQSATITAVQLAAGSVTTAKVAAGAITANEIAAGAVTASAIQAAAITGVAIAAGTITGDKVAANTIYGAHVVASTITSRELLLTDYTNLLMNGSFQSGDNTNWSSWPTGWDVYAKASGGSAAVTNAPTAYMGRINTDTTSASGPYANRGIYTECKAGDQFWISLSAAKSGSSGAANLLRMMRYFILADGSSSPGVSWYFTSALSTTWQTITANFTAPANAVGVRVRVYYNGDSGLGAIYFSEFTLRRKNGAELIVDGAIIADHLAVNSITASKIVAGSIESGHISNAAITNAKIANAAITSSKRCDLVLESA